MTVVDSYVYNMGIDTTPPKMNLQKNDIKKIKRCISFAIENDANLNSTDIDELKEISSLLYFYQLENQKKEVK